MQTGSVLVASRFTSRTRAGSPSAVNNSAVAAACSLERTGDASGAQQLTEVGAFISEIISIIFDMSNPDPTRLPNVESGRSRMPRDA